MKKSLFLVAIIILVVLVVLTLYLIQQAVGPDPEVYPELGPDPEVYQDQVPQEGLERPTPHLYEDSEDGVEIISEEPESPLTWEEDGDYAESVGPDPSGYDDRDWYDDPDVGDAEAGADPGDYEDDSSADDPLGEDN